MANLQKQLNTIIARREITRLASKLRKQNDGIVTESATYLGFEDGYHIVKYRGEKKKIPPKMVMGFGAFEIGQKYPYIGGTLDNISGSK